MSGSLDLTGTWVANDRGIYYIRQVGTDIYWAGLSAARGLIFTNVIHGTIQAGSTSVVGEWADIPRGTILGNGTLTLSIDTTTRPAVPTLQKQSETGTGFGGSSWEKVTIAVPPGDIRFRFDHTQRNDGGTMHDHLKMYKDNVVVFGDIVEPLGVGFPATVPRDYCSFIAAPWNNSGGDPPDGDITFQIRIDRANLDGQPNFWSEGWLNDPNHIRNKLNNNKDNKLNQMHPEIIMYGRDKDADHCREGGRSLLPGWMETSSNSILLNGRPVNGNVDFGPPTRLLRREIAVGSRVRVTGFLALDCHGGDCDEDNPEDHNVEIHPVYMIDILQDFTQPRPGADLTGVWHANDVGTYYIRQVGSTVWWLGLSRDQGQTFANVFHGTIQSNAITGNWADVPIAGGGAPNSGSLNLIGDGMGSASTGLTGGGPFFGGSRWLKLYDVTGPPVISI